LFIEDKHPTKLTKVPADTAATREGVVQNMTRVEHNCFEQPLFGSLKSGGILEMTVDRSFLFL